MRLPNKFVFFFRQEILKTGRGGLLHLIPHIEDTERAGLGPIAKSFCTNVQVDLAIRGFPGWI